MSLNDLEQRVYAFYVAGPADELDMVGRWWPYAELIMILEDKVALSMRPFGTKAKGSARTVATAFVDKLIEDGAYSTQVGKFGGSMHQFQPARYKELLVKYRAENPIIQANQAGGPDQWATDFNTHSA